MDEPLPPPPPAAPALPSEGPVAIVVPPAGRAEEKPAPMPPVAHKSLDMAFLAAQMDFEPIARDGLNPEKGYTFATLPNVLGKLVPVLNRHGLSLMQPTDVVERAGMAMMIVRTQIIHAKTGKARESVYPVWKGFLPHQAMAAMVTQVRRYAALSMMGVAPENDDDGQVAAKVGATASLPVSDPAAPAPETPYEPPPTPADFKAAPFAAEGALDAMLNAVETEAELDALLQSATWNDTPRNERRAYDDKITVIRQMIAEGGGRRPATASSRRGGGASAGRVHLDRAIGANEPEAASAADVGDPVLYVELLRRLGKIKKAYALGEWRAELTDERMGRLSKTERDSLHAEYRRKCADLAGLSDLAHAGADDSAADTPAKTVHSGAGAAPARATKEEQPS